jgi:VCBS repeat-containing protein
MASKIKSFQESKTHTLNKWCIGLLSLGLISTSVLAGSNSTTLPNGAVCAVTIESPLTGDEFTLPNNDPTMDIQVNGSAGVTEGDPLTASFVYVMDISGSTADGGGTGCAPILNCEQKFLKALNQEIITQGVSNEVGMVVYAATAAIADMTPTTGVQQIIAPNAGDGTYLSYVNTVVDSTVTTPAPSSIASKINQFTPYTVGRTTDCREGLVNALTVANATTHNPKIVIFTSDGICNEGGQTNFNAAVTALHNAGVIVHSVAVGTDSSCATNGGHGSLQQIADGTGGLCFEVPDPGNLPAIIPSFVAPVLSSLDLQVDGGTPIQILNSDPLLPQPGPVSVDYTTLAESLGVGSHEICVTANCSEPEGAGSATQCETIEINPTPQFDLTVNLTGNGSGNVGSTPAGITCGADCNELYNVGTSVTLTATPDANSNFTGWSGACSGTDANATVTMDAAKNCTANFVLKQFDLTVNLVGSGTVASNPAGIACGADCNELYNMGTNVTLTATPAANSNFIGWSGASCSTSTNPVITVTMDAAKTCTATFNAKPVAIDDSYTTNEDQPLTIAAPGVLANDNDGGDGGPLSVVSNTQPSHGTVAQNPNGSFTYTPNLNYCGTDSFTYTVSDGQATDTATVTITVACVNDPPVAVDDNYTATEDQPLMIAASGVLANDNDGGDGGPLSVVSNTQPSNGTVAQNPDGSFTYTPNPDFCGTDSFTYTVSDGQATDAAIVTITVACVNDPPVAVNDSYTTIEDQPITIAAPGVLGNDTDPDGDSLTVVSNTQPSNGTVTQNADGSFTYMPNPDFCGVDSFTYTISDGHGGTDTATVTLEVACQGLRMTGGGTLEKGKGKGKVGVSHGFELHCNPNELPNNLEVNWNNKSDKFHLETLTSATCIDDPTISEAPPVAGFDTYIGQGIGRYNGVSGATITWVFTDAGEPGKDNDYGEITITDANGNVVLSITGSLNQGNHQAH